MNFMFDLEDASNDGTIDAQEFALVCSSYGLDAKECEQAFAKMSKVKDECLKKKNSTFNYRSCRFWCRVLLR